MNLTGVHLDNLNIAFHKAVEAQDYAKILFLFDAGANVNSKVHGGKSMVGSFEDGRFAPRWSFFEERPSGYVWSPDDPWEEDTRTQEDFRQGVAISGGGLAQDKRMGITALMRAAAVGHEGSAEKKGGWQPSNHFLLYPEEAGRRHPRHWVIRLLLMLGADPKIPGGWTCFGESILEILSMHPSRLSGNSKCMFYVSSY